METREEQIHDTVTIRHHVWASTVLGTEDAKMNKTSVFQELTDHCIINVGAIQKSILFISQDYFDNYMR